MAKDDLMSHAQSDVDFYALLDVSFSSSASDIRRAYRKTALKYHPDKLGDAFDPEKFHLLQIANDVLSDETAKAAYDSRRAAKVKKQAQERLFEGRRRQMKEELEARERGGTSSVATVAKRQRDEGQEMDAEIRKLAEEGKRRRMEMQSKMDAAEAAASPTPEPKASTPQLIVPEAKRERTPQTAQEEAEEEDEVARLERRIREISEAKEKRRAERKARKSGVFVQSETPSASPKPESKPSVADAEPRRFSPNLSSKFTPRRPVDDIKSSTPVSSPKFSFSPKPRTVPAAGNDEFAATMQRLKEAEKKRLEEEIRKREAETPL